MELLQASTVRSGNPEINALITPPRRSPAREARCPPTWAGSTACATSSGEISPVRNKDATFSIDTGFAVTGAQRAATHGHLDPDPVWPSRFEQVKMLPLHKTGLRAHESSQKLPCRHHGSSGHGHSQRKGWKKSTLFGGGEERLPKTLSHLFCQNLQNPLLGFAEERHLVTEETTKVIQDHRSSQCKSRSGCGERAREIRRHVLSSPM